MRRHSVEADRVQQRVDNLHPGLRRVGITVPRLPWLEHEHEEEEHERDDDRPARAHRLGSDGRDFTRERREDRETMALLDELEARDKELAADDVEEALADWNDPLTGLPLVGESPRFRTDRERAYMDWIHSGGGARTRATVHPKLDERLRRESSEHR